MTRALQRFTVELERIDTLRTTLEVVSTDIARATIQAQDKVRKNSNLWLTDRGDIVVKKITAHANKRGAL